ncbi:MAG: CARDB domain-containing protein [Thermoplasmatota archaeon]
MTSALPLLVQENVRAWLRPRTWVLVLLAVLVPAGLTAAWVLTHENDVAVTAITFGPGTPTDGAPLNISVTVANLFHTPSPPVNITVTVGFFDVDPVTGQRSFVQEVLNQTVRAPGIAPHASTVVKVRWTATAGLYFVQANVDPGNEIPEFEKANNQRFVQLLVPYPQVHVTLPPRVADNSTPVPARLESLTWSPATPYAGDNITFTVEATNIGPAGNLTLHLDVNPLQVLPGQVGCDLATQEGPAPQNVSFAAGATRTATFRQNVIAAGRYCILAHISQGAHTNGANLTILRPLDVDHRLVFPEPPVHVTAKSFYVLVLDVLQLKLLIPLIALFYAGGTLSDEREAGNLPYLLSRPVPRGMLPLVRFAASFLMATAAICLGVVATFLLLLGQPSADLAYLLWPLAFSVLALFVFTALATLLGVTVERPYLVGVLYVLGWEALLVAGRSVLLNGQPLLQDWVQYASLDAWVDRALMLWKRPGAVDFWPTGPSPMVAAVGLVGIGVAALVGASWWMRRRDFAS